MEPVAKSDLKELMKELRESMKESIREAVAAGFGNSKPTLEQATTSSQLLAMDASDAEVLAPTYSRPDQGTSALDLAPTATVDLLPELAAPTHASCSTDGHDTSGDGSKFEPLIPWGTMQSTAASLEASRTQPCRLFLSLEVDAKAPTRCSTKGSVKTASAFKVNFVPRSCPTAPSDGINNSYVEPPPWLPGWTSTGFHKTWECLLHVPARPPDSLNSTQRRLFPRRPHLATPAPKPPWLLLGHELVGESYGGKLPSHGDHVVCELIICNEFSETAPTTTKSEVIQGNLSSPPSGIIMNDPCNLKVMRCLDHVLLRMKKWWSNIQCTQLGDANFEASSWPGRHIIGSCLVSPVHKFTVAIDSDWLYTHILHGQFPMVGNQLTRQCRAQPWLGNILVQIATSQTGANCCFRGTSHQVEKHFCCYWGSDQEMFSYGRVGCLSEANDKEEMTYYICDITYEFYRETLKLVGSMWKTYNFRFNWISLVGLVQCHNTLLGDVLSAPQLILCMSIKYRTEQKFEGSHSLLATMELSIFTIHKGVLQIVENFRELKSPTTTENNDPNNSVISVSTPHINSIGTCSFGLLMGDSNSIDNALFELALGQAISQDERNVRFMVSKCCYVTYIHRTKQLRYLFHASCKLATPKTGVIPGSQLQFCWSGSATIILLENFPEFCSQLNCQWRVQSCLGVILVHISTSQTRADCCARETSDLVEKFSCCFGDSDGTECADTLLLILLLMAN